MNKEEELHFHSMWKKFDVIESYAFHLMNTGIDKSDISDKVRKKIREEYNDIDVHDQIWLWDGVNDTTLNKCKCNFCESFEEQSNIISTDRYQQLAKNDNIGQLVSRLINWKPNQYNAVIDEKNNEIPNICDTCEKEIYEVISAIDKINNEANKYE